MCVFLCVRVLAGYNGTIFAYGQTNSGKTFTITGGARSYGDRGIIPRTLSYLYQHIIQVSTRAWMADYVSVGFRRINPLVISTLRLHSEESSKNDASDSL